MPSPMTIATLEITEGIATKKNSISPPPEYLFGQSANQSASAVNDHIGKAIKTALITLPRLTADEQTYGAMRR